MNDYLALLVGAICAGIGGELFVRGTVGLASWLRVAPGIIGATVAAFATSSPELSVGIFSASHGTPEISFGDVLGSNVVNVALILGLALLLGPIRATHEEVRRDFFGALAVPAIIGVLALDGAISRLDSLLLLTGFAAWLALVLREARRQRAIATAPPIPARGGIALAQSAIGLVLLIAAGRMFVLGASGLAVTFGVSEFIIGAVIVAIGTSMPELATTLIARLRGHDAAGLGTILGSNIFNGLFIVAVAALIHPIRVDAYAVAVALVFSLVVTAITYPSHSHLIGRTRGVLMLVLYMSYLWITLQTATTHALPH